jgi:hypothetical protein
MGCSPDKEDADDGGDVGAAAASTRPEHNEQGVLRR